MLENLSFQYPSWYLILCVLLGLALAALMYWRDNRFSEQNKWVIRGLALLRATAVSGLAMLLLSPLLKHTTEDIKNPIVILLNDNSESIAAGMEESNLASFNQNLDGLSQSIEEKFELIKLNFGDEVISGGEESNTEPAKITNIAKALDYINDGYNDYNLGAILLVSDGIYNEGKNPLYQNLKFKAPIYSIALGDTTIKKDLLVKHVYHNKIAYLDDKFGVQVDIQAKGANQSRSKLRLQKYSNGKWQNIREEPISITNDDFFETKNLVLDANQAGLQRYRVVLNQIDDESSTSNNIKDIYIEVLDAKQKILLFANSPNPDLAALKQMLENNKNYEIEIKFPKDNFKILDYDLVVFHNLPSTSYDISSMIQLMEAKKTPRIFVVGQQTNLASFNDLQNVISISGKSNNSNEVQALSKKGFSLFRLEENTTSKLEQFVPVLAPFGEYSEGPNTNTLLYQKIGKIETKYPLLSFSEVNGIKTCVLAAEGIWRWKLFEYLQTQKFDVVDDLLSKTITYTSVKEDKRKFRVSTSDNLFKENERILFDAQLYNNSYQLVNEPEVFITIKKDGNEEFNYTFSQKDKSYVLDVGILSEGNYTYESYVNYEGKKLSQKGSFTVQSIQLELYNLTADHSLLNSLSNKYGGKMYMPNQLDLLQNDIASNNAIKPIVYPTTSTKSIIHYKWIFGLLFSFLGIEWFLRRYLGSY